MENSDKSDISKTASAKTADGYQQLQEENTRLKALLKQHRSSWEDEPVEEPRLQLPNTRQSLPEFGISVNVVIVQWGTRFAHSKLNQEDQKSD